MSSQTNPSDHIARTSGKILSIIRVERGIGVAYKKVVYSAMVGQYDKIRSMNSNKEWLYVMFVDFAEVRIPQNSNWEFRQIDKSVGISATHICRWYKTHPHILFPECEVSIWIDANIEILSFDFINKKCSWLREHDIKISSCEHPHRDCIYDEINACRKGKRDTDENLAKIHKYIEKHHYPHTHGLFETGFMYREHNDESIVHLSEEWWFIIDHYSNRDQLSINFLLWKNGVKSDYFFGKKSCVRNRKDVKYYHHGGTIISLMRYFFSKLSRK